MSKFRLKKEHSGDWVIEKKVPIFRYWFEAKRLDVDSYKRAKREFKNFLKNQKEEAEYFYL